MSDRGRVWGDYTLCRVGKGIRPSVLVQATASANSGWNGELLNIDVRRVELFQWEGDPRKLARRIEELRPLQRTFSGRLSSVPAGRSTHREPEQHDLAVDVSNSPKFHDYQLPYCAYYTLRTGMLEQVDNRKHTLGRLLVFSVLQQLLAQKKITFSPTDDWPDVQQALKTATAVPGSQEQDGLILTDSTLNDDTALAVALMAYRVSEKQPHSSAAPDYSHLDRAVI